MRVTFVNRFYWPAEPATAQLLTDLAEGLAERGATVRIITGHTAPGLPARSSRRGVEIVGVGPPIQATQNLFRRARDFTAFRAAAGQALMDLLQAGDLAVALTDPPLLGITVARAAAARGARIVHWTHDIYPEIFHAVARNPVSWLSQRWYQPARNAAWRAADACVVLGDDMADVVRAAGVDATKVRVIPNWAPHGLGAVARAETEAARRRWGIAETDFVVGYSGNLGRVHDLDGLLDVAGRLRNERSIGFLLVGAGAAFARLQRVAQQRGLDRVRFLPPQPRAELSAALAVADLHVISVREGCERLVFPSKLYGVAAIGRPVLGLAPPGAELARVIATHELGAAFAPSETERIAKFVCELAASPARREALGAAALRFHAAAGGSGQALASWAALLRELDAQP
jgi:colanic acid biosynthesis glycosyl transferase WcaI